MKGVFRTCRYFIESLVLSAHLSSLVLFCRTQSSAHTRRCPVWTVHSSRSYWETHLQKTCATRQWTFLLFLLSRPSVPPKKQKSEFMLFAYNYSAGENLFKGKVLEVRRQINRQGALPQPCGFASLASRSFFVPRTVEKVSTVKPARFGNLPYWL